MRSLPEKPKAKLSLTFFILLCLLFASLLLLDQASSRSKGVREAMYYKKLEGNKVWCQLCPWKCIVAEGQRGTCGVRENRKGTYYTLVFSNPCALHVDPIEKKPFYHVFPSSSSFSIATVGCNFKCKYCQNWEISQALPEDIPGYDVSPQKVVELALENNCKTIAFTYTEPVIFYEYMLETAKIAKAKGVKTVCHTNGFINPEPLRELCKYLDAANVDLKGFTEEFYNDVLTGELEPVLKSLKILKAEKVWVEITNLIVPTLNDDPKKIREMCQWIRDNLGSDVPLHLSRFYPMYKLKNLAPTPVETLEKARKIALEVGLRYVYIGNVFGHQGENTYCPKCKKLLIQRIGFDVRQNNLNKDKCKYCGQPIPGLWN